MAREKMPEFKRKGNWKNAPGSQAATKKSRGVATTEAVKKMKQKESTAPKPKPKPAKPAAKPKIGTGAKPKAKPAMSKTTSSSNKANVKDYKRTGKVAPEPSAKAKALFREYRDSGKVSGSRYAVPIARAMIARGGTHFEAGKTRHSLRRAKKTNQTVKGNVAPKKPQNRSGSTGPEPKKNWGMTRAMSKNSVTRMRKPLNTGARSSRTSGTGYKEGSFMDRMTRAVRRNVYGKK